ncbi:class I SAM-dependent methyltransferase [Bradyrhizobium genosp. P]|uniref:class I SAM-dependent methyltransferase n=1 Tax=Bradyrhizobium genosp. P TaxID=83641 RepID=UPI003CF316B8
MKILGRYTGKLGEIEIWESKQTGDRLYREGELFQSESSASGESRFPYVKMMEVFLSDAKSVLLLGCGGGNLATMLARQGKSVTIVDHDPVSFDLARRFFGLPGQIPCVVSDFREYLLAETRSFDGIAIDVGGPGFCFEEQFDPATCHSITALLKPGGRAVLNMLVATDFDAAPDLIGGDLSEGHMTSWIFDQPGCLNRNVLIACLPRQRQAANRRYMAKFSQTVGCGWAPRRPRRPSHDSRAVVVDIACAS